MVNPQTLQVKYRPHTYDTVVGQEHITTILRGLRINGGYTFSNSIIFYGTAGGGKTTISRIYAQSVNCQNPNNGEACGVCESCVAFAKGVYPDFIEIDGASYGKVEDARQLIQMFNQYTIVKNGFRIILVDECHRLSKQAWDIFLKPLEEGNTNTIFLFATTEFDKIPSAIVSRSIVCGVRSASSQQIRDQLVRICKAENIAYNDESLDKISYVFRGKMRDAIKTLDMYVKSQGNALTINIENVEERILRVIQLSLFNKVDEAYTILDETFIDSSFSSVLNSVLATIMLYPNISNLSTMISDEHLLNFSKLIGRDVIKRVCRDFAELKPRNSQDFKLFCAIIADYGIKIMDREVSTQKTATQSRRRQFASNDGGSAVVRNTSTEVSVKLPSGWTIK